MHTTDTLAVLIHFVDSTGKLHTFSPKGFAARCEDVTLRTHNDRAFVRGTDGIQRDVTPMGARS